MTFPPGRKPGLKKDKPSKVMGRCNPVSSVIEDIPDQYWDELAANEWHKTKDTCYRYTLDQNGTGSCAAESMIGTGAACDARQGQPLVLFNPLFTYHTTSGGRDNGSVIGDNLEHGREYGRCPEEIWPRSKGFKTKPNAQAYDVAKFFRIREFFYVETIEQFVSALLQGYFVHAGYSGHAVSFSRYLGKGVLWFKNSWGDWGENGFGTLKLSNVYFGYGAYAYKDTVPYWHVTKGWGTVNDDGSFTPCPWKPNYHQGKLASAVNEYQVNMTDRITKGQRISDTMASHIYAVATAHI